ncbi:MAG: hypothetical protein JWP44_2240 [Mucilaginibacter sp.]|nr:hypothetical protein [Mucilaginibacter sp.]
MFIGDDLFFLIDRFKGIFGETFHNFSNKHLPLLSNIHYTAKVLRIKAVSSRKGPHLQGSGYYLKNFQSKKK